MKTTLKLRRPLRTAALAALGLAAAAVSGAAAARAGQGGPFVEIARFAAFRNLPPEKAQETAVAEIVAATADGKVLVYTDSKGRRLGFVDITDPADPKPSGAVPLGGEPTSVDVLGNRYALVVVDTSSDHRHPSGMLVTVSLARHEIVHRMPLGGQPDSIKISPDGRFAAIAIENERDEDRVVGGVKGGLPQMPPGFLAIVDLLGDDPARWALRKVPLSGLARYGAEDPEPEFVDINARNEAAVTLQENNHLVVVALETGEILTHFDLGAVTLEGIDTRSDGVIEMTGRLSNAPREPDGVAWVADEHGRPALIATANEGDLFGGSRGFTLFDLRGRVVFDSGAQLERLAVEAGLYPENRAGKRGIEPEGVAYGSYGGRRFLFVGAERGDFVAVYELEGRTPVFRQLLSTPPKPEGVLTIPARGLVVVSGEKDKPQSGRRASIAIYRFAPGA